MIAFYGFLAFVLLIGELLIFHPLGDQPHPDEETSE